MRGTARGGEDGSRQEISGGVWAGTVVVALVLAIGLFFLIPVGLTSLIKGQLHSSVLFWVIEGLVRTAIFLGYMFLLSRMRDLRRVFEYHGAEHKTISCFEAGLPLTPANAQRFSRLHPRCGTSFLLVVMIVAIFVFAPIGLPAWYWLVATRILGVPLIAGISFELIKFAGRNRRRRWVQAVMWPGLKLQLLTTREPDLDQLAVAIAALRGGARAGDPRRALGGRPDGRRGRGLARAGRAAAPAHLDCVCMIEDLVAQMESRFAELGEQLTDPEVISDRERYAEVGRAYSQLEPAAKLAVQWRRAQDDADRGRRTAGRGRRGRRRCARS